MESFWVWPKVISLSSVHCTYLDKLQWNLLNEITLERREIDNIDWMITICKHMGYIHKTKKCDFGVANLNEFYRTNWFDNIIHVNNKQYSLLIQKIYLWIQIFLFISNT
jgi:hypothetical protein